MILNILRYRSQYDLLNTLLKIAIETNGVVYTAANVYDVQLRTNVHNIDKGDEVIIFGREGVTVDDLAEWLETINYEVSCVIGKRIPRIYTKDGKAVKVLNYLM